MLRIYVSTETGDDKNDGLSDQRLSALSMSALEGEADHA